MTLGETELMVYDQLNISGTPDSGSVRRIRQDINIAQKQILGMKGFGILRRKILTTASVASSPYMVMPQAAVLIDVIADRANNRNLDVISLRDIRFRDPGLTFSGSTPDSYCVLNYASAVAIEPSAAASLFVISDSAIDGTGISATVEGVVTGGYYRKASIAMAGLTAVNISTAISTWISVTKFYLSGGAAGNVTLHQTSGTGTELSRIPPGRSSARYTMVHLSGTPSTALTYYCDVELHVEDMSNINDESILHEDYHWLLACGALRRNYLKREKMSQYGAETTLWKDGIASMGSQIRRMAGVKTRGQRTSDYPGRQFSQLGPNYPAGS